MNEFASHCIGLPVKPEAKAGVKTDCLRRRGPGCRALASMEAGDSGVVAAIEVPPQQRSRILEMGLVVGTKVQVVRFAPMGDPVEIKLRGYHLTLRRHEAEQIQIQAA